MNMVIAETVARRCFVKKVVLKSFEKFTREHLHLGLFISGDFIVFLFFKRHLFPCDTYLVEHLRTTAFGRKFFLELFRKFQKIFMSTNEQMFLIYIIHKQMLLIRIAHTVIVEGGSHKFLIIALSFGENGNVCFPFLPKAKVLIEYLR